MQAQETLANAALNLHGNRAALVIVVVAVALLAPAIDQVLQLVEIRLPLRQLLTGRSLQSLALSARIAFAMAGFCIGSKLASRTMLAAEAR